MHKRFLKLQFPFSFCFVLMSLPWTSHLDLFGNPECDYHAQVTIGSTLVIMMKLNIHIYKPANILFLDESCFRYRLLQYSSDF